MKVNKTVFFSCIYRLVLYHLSQNQNIFVFFMTKTRLHTTVAVAKGIQGLFLALEKSFACRISLCCVLYIF